MNDNIKEEGELYEVNSAR